VPADVFGRHYTFYDQGAIVETLRAWLDETVGRAKKGLGECLSK
jgi:hypothetical protein